jgi:uncharacterized protein YjbJ (UPF0337 family)
MKSSTEDKAKGTAKTVAGGTKEKTGKLFNNPRMEEEGREKKVEGKVQKKVGEVKQVVGH